MSTQVILLFFIGIILIILGFLIWQRNKKKSPKVESQGYSFSARDMAILERDYYRLYLECTNCGYVCGTYIKRGIPVEDYLCPNCVVKGKCRPVTLKSYKGVDVVIPDLPREPEECDRAQILKGTKSRMWG